MAQLKLSPRYAVSPYLSAHNKHITQNTDTTLAELTAKPRLTPQTPDADGAADDGRSLEPDDAPS
jgi:hypothetical protein